MGERKTIDSTAMLLMVFFCLCMGLQQVALKAVADAIPPVFQLALRSGIAAMLVALFLYYRRQALYWKGGYWKPGVVVGVLFTLEYLFLGEALKYTSAAHAVVFLYLSPIFSALILHFRVADERLSRLQWLGTLIAFVGMAVAFLGREGGHADGSFSAMLLGDGLALLAALAWGATTVVIRGSRLATIPAAQTLLYQLVGAFVLLLSFAWLTGQATLEPTPLALASLGFQSAIVSFVCFLIWFWLLRHYQVSRLGTLSFMTPLFGVGFGAWLLAEPVEPGFTAGALLVMGGLILVNGANGLQGIWAKAAGKRRPPTLEDNVRR
ncbi:MAG: DMT family transporter [Gammaproteobacteria bacterium]|nr:DMT family transporter [Gammaproteobacteria bacterium]